jgi:aspartate aminotransferase
MISSRIQQLAPSPTLALDAKVKELQAQGKQVINLCLGEPDFDTPKHIQQAAIEAMHGGFTHYTATAGIPELRQAIAEKFLQDNKLEYDPSQIVVGVGSKQLLYHAFQVLCNEGDEVLVHTPTWSTYVEQIKLAQAKPVLVPLAPPFKLKAVDIEAYLTPRTKVILLNSPCNPTGAIIEREELEKIAQLAVKNKLYIISDEIYEKILYGGTHYSIASFGEEIRKRTITINGFSKAYAMTGWRIGYAAGPKDIIKSMVDLQSQTTSNTSSIAQKAAVAALRGSQDQIGKMVNEFSARRSFLLKKLSDVKELDIIKPEGAFYLWVSVKKLLNSTSPTSQIWCERLLIESKIAVVPGEAFLYPGYFRLSFATSMSELEVAAAKIRNTKF